MSECYFVFRDFLYNDNSVAEKSKNSLKILYFTIYSLYFNATHKPLCLWTMKEN